MFPNGVQKSRKDKLMEALMTWEEMKDRYQKGEDSFELTIEKWTRIKSFLNEAIGLSDFKKMLEGAVIPVPFCLQYQVNNCYQCPLEGICGRGKGEKFSKIIRIIQAYSLAGDMLPKSILLVQVENFILELEMCRAKDKGLIH